MPSFQFLFEFYSKIKQQFCSALYNMKNTKISLFFNILYFFSCAGCIVYIFLLSVIGICWLLLTLSLFLSEILILCIVIVSLFNCFVWFLKVFFPRVYLDSTFFYTGVSEFIEQYCCILFPFFYFVFSFFLCLYDWEQVYLTRLLFYSLTVEDMLIADDFCVQFGFSPITTVSSYVAPVDKEVEDLVAVAVQQYTQPIVVSSEKKEMSLLVSGYTSQVQSSPSSSIPVFKKDTGCSVELALGSILFSGISSGQSIYGDCGNIVSVLQQADPFFFMEERFVMTEELMSTEYYFLKRNIFPGILTKDYYKNQILKVGEAVLDNIKKPHPQVATICYSPKYKIYLLLLNGLTTTPDIPNTFVQALCCNKQALINVGVIELILNSNTQSSITKDSYVLPMSKLFVFTEADFKQKADLLLADARNICTTANSATPKELHYYKSTVFPVFEKLGLVSASEVTQLVQATEANSRALMVQFSAQITEERCFDSVVEKYTDLKSVFPASKSNAFLDVKKALSANTAIAPCYTQFKYQGASGVIYPVKVINTLFKNYSIVPMVAKKFLC